MPLMKALMSLFPEWLAAQISGRQKSYYSCGQTEKIFASFAHVLIKVLQKIGIFIGKLNA